MAEDEKEKQKNKRARVSVPKRRPGLSIDQPHISRTNPLADLLFGSITPEMVAAAGRREEWSSTHAKAGATGEALQQPAPSASSTELPDRSDRSDQPERSEKYSITPAESNEPQARGFLALPHALLDRMFAELRHYSAFKVYLYLYREAFRRVHDERPNAKCSLPLTVLTKQCAMPNSVVRDAMKVLARDHWIAIESRSGTPSLYAINRPIDQPEFTELQVNGFLAFPHALLDRMFAKIPNYAAFKVYLYLYREAFRWVHDQQLRAKCSVPLTVLTNQCAISDKGARKALKVLVRGRWITIENQKGVPSLYSINRLIGPVQSGGLTPPDCTGGPPDCTGVSETTPPDCTGVSGTTPPDCTEHLKKDHDKKSDDKNNIIKKAANDDRDSIIEAFELIIGTRFKPNRDNSALALIRKFTPATIEAGFIIAKLRAKTKINSVAYCVPVIEEVARAGISDDATYLRYLRSKLSDTTTAVRKERNI